MKEHRATVRLLSHAPYGHTLNRRQVLSPDREWCVYDTRNHDPDIGITTSIERLHLKSGDVELLYSTLDSVHCPNVSSFGPGVGAVAYHPNQDKVIFIHGLTDCSEASPYAMSRRFGAVLDLPTGSLTALETRCTESPIAFGHLSGGTHAHSWSPSGARVSFTYDDALAPNYARTVGWAEFHADSDASIPTLKLIPTPKPRGNTRSESPTFPTGGSFTGASNCYLLTTCSEGSGIQQAVEECWVGEDAIAFLGKVQCPDSGATRFEIFLAHLLSARAMKDFKPESVKRNQVGTPSLNEYVRIEQLTELGGQPFPGVQGPRHWLIADSEGEWIYFLAKDENGIVQLNRVHSRSSERERLTDLSNGIEGQPSLSGDDKRVAFVSNQKLHWWDSANRATHCVEEVSFLGRSGSSCPSNVLRGSYVGAAHFVDDRSWIVNRYATIDGKDYLQILKVDLI